MKKLVFVLLLLITSVGISQAQVLNPVLGPRAWEKENVEQSSAVTLTHIREADVMWSKRIWRTIDLRQKINLILYYPVMDSATLGKRSFVQVVFDEFINNPQNIGPNRVRMYESYQLNSLDEMTREEVLEYVTPSDSASVEEEASAVSTDNANAADASAEDDWGDDYSDDGGSASDFVIVKKRVKKEFFDIKPDIIKIELMEDWFFDKQRSVLDVRILAIGIKFPVWEMKESLNADDVTVFGGWDKKGDGKTIWFYYPALRDELAKHECFKRHNDAARVSYDDIFLSRMFGSYITKKENVYDRYINQYTGGLDALLEAEKISNEIEQFEQNLWEY